MGELTTDVNWIAVIVGAVVAFLVGWLWYSPKLFGKKWAAGVGTLDEDKPSAMAMIWQLIATFLFAWVVGVTAASNALLTIFLITFAIVALVISSGLFTGKSTYAIGTEAGYIVVMAAVMIICQGIF